MPNSDDMVKAALLRIETKIDNQDTKIDSIQQSLSSEVSAIRVHMAGTDEWRRELDRQRTKWIDDVWPSHLENEGTMSEDIQVLQKGQISGERIDRIEKRLIRLEKWKSKVLTVIGVIVGLGSFIYALGQLIIPILFR